MTLGMASDFEKQDHAPRRRWGGQRALFNDEEAVALLLDAAGRCIAQRGNARIAMAEVAEEAGVTRSTLYRYFPSRSDLVKGLLLARAERFVAASVAAMPDPGDAAASLTHLILHPVEAMRGTPITDALFSPESEGLVVSMELESEAIFQIAFRHFSPFLTRWHAEGQLQPDIEIAMTVRWIIGLAVLLLSPPWQALSGEERTKFVNAYVVRALVLA